MTEILMMTTVPGTVTLALRAVKKENGRLCRGARRSSAMSKNKNTPRRKRGSAIAQRSLPLYMPARPREEYRLRDLIERLDLALDTYIGAGDRAVIEEAAAYLHELYLVTTEKRT